MTTPTPETRAAAETCLAQAISYEAGREPEAGQEAIAQVVLNRLNGRSYPKTVCGVVFQGSTRRSGCQFTFTCDGSMDRRRPGATWANALRVARLALDGQLHSPIGTATHYHAVYVNPAWAARLTQVGRIGAHIFYDAPTRRSPDASIASAAPRGPHGNGHPAPRTTIFSVWGLQTAVLKPGPAAIQVQPIARPAPATDPFTPLRAPETADPPSP